jgi:ectoine hydroxylase-related dioxygenase (phytanoyl-CoA dioxygenase family)
MMQQNKRKLEKQTHKNLNERLLLAYNCNSEMIIKHVIDRDDIKSIKQAVYIRKEMEYYPDKIMKIYNEFNNLKVE